MKGHNGSVGTLYKRSICKCFKVCLNNNVTDLCCYNIESILVNLVHISILEITVNKPVYTNKILSSRSPERAMI
jgi:hypothetical protein